MSTNPVVFANERLVVCPMCVTPLWSFSWSLAMRTDDAEVYELAARCDPCNRWWVVAYSREDRSGTPAGLIRQRETTHDAGGD